MAINRTNDFAFKWIFGNKDRKDLLLNFINSVLTDDDQPDLITDIQLLDRELDPKYYLDKSSRLDILAETLDKTQINIEIQTTYDKNIDKRSLFYWAKVYQNQLTEGMEYKDLRPTIAINILSFNYLHSPAYYNQFVLMEKTQKYQLNDTLQLHFIELKKWINLSIKTRNRLERWLLFLANNDPVELEAIALHDYMIKKALDAEKKFLSDKQARYIYDMREKDKLDRASFLSSAKESGIKEGMERGMERGIKQGIEQEKKAMVISMLKKGMDTKTIQEISQLSLENIETLKKSL